MHLTKFNNNNYLKNITSYFKFQHPQSFTKLSWISIQQELAFIRQIVTELNRTHAHERQNEVELSDFSDKKGASQKLKNLKCFAQKITRLRN